jgi:ribosomal protein L37AE/L43A
MTRKQKIHEILMRAPNEWVNGDRLMQADTGGGRFGARIEELRKDGFEIEARRHPDPKRDIWQYRIIYKKFAQDGDWRCITCNEVVSAGFAVAYTDTLDPKTKSGYCPKCKKTRHFNSA